MHGSNDNTAFVERVDFAKRVAIATAEIARYWYDNPESPDIHDEFGGRFGGFPAVHDYLALAAVQWVLAEDDNPHGWKNGDYYGAVEDYAGRIILEAQTEFENGANNFPDSIELYALAEEIIGEHEFCHEELCPNCEERLSLCQCLPDWLVPNNQAGPEFSGFVLD